MNFHKRKAISRHGFLVDFAVMILIEDSYEDWKVSETSESFITLTQSIAIFIFFYNSKDFLLWFICNI